MNEAELRERLEQTEYWRRVYKSAALGLAMRCSKDEDHGFMLYQATVDISEKIIEDIEDEKAKAGQDH